MLRLTYPGGITLEATDETSQRLLLEQQSQLQVYSVTQLAIRLGISQNRAYDLIRQGLIDYCCCGAKNYRVGEHAVRRFLLGFKPLN